MDMQPSTHMSGTDPQSQFASPQAAPHIQPAGFWIRFAAAVVDGIVIAIVTFPFNYIAGLVLQNVLAPTVFLFVTWVIQIAITFSFFGYFYSTKGASPGKMIFNMGVVNSDNGTMLSFVKAGLRETVGKLISTIPFFIGYIMAAFTQDKKALHDMIFKTQVIRRVK